MQKRGLRSLIPTGMIQEPQPAAAPTPGLVQEVPLDRIRTSRFQPRQDLTEEGLEELTESVRQHGVLQPLVVRPVGEGEWELIAGERRYRAAQRAGLTTVPVVMREADDRTALELALVENLQREDINPMEAATAYDRLMREFGLTQEQVAQRVGKSRSAVSNTLRLLTLPPEVQESLRKGEIEEGHGRALAAVHDAKLAVRLWRKVVKRNLSVQQTQALVKEALEGSASREANLGRPKFRAPLDPNLADLERRLTIELDAKVKLRPQGEGGVMEVHYASWQELDYVVRQILSALSRARREAEKYTKDE